MKEKRKGEQGSKRRRNMKKRKEKKKKTFEKPRVPAKLARRLKIKGQAHLNIRRTTVFITERCAIKER